MEMGSPFIKRAALAKLIGFCIGLIGFFIIPSLWPGESMWLRVGFLMWYTTFGAIIGVLGLVDYHPFLKFPMPFWVRGIVFGCWLNLVLVFLMHDKLTVLMQALPSPLGAFQSPFWIVLEGAVIGLLIDGVVTKCCGEGRALVQN